MTVEAIAVLDTGGNGNCCHKKDCDQKGETTLHTPLSRRLTEEAPPALASAYQFLNGKIIFQEVIGRLLITTTLAPTRLDREHWSVRRLMAG